VVGLLTIKQEVITFGIHPRESVYLFNRQKTVKLNIFQDEERDWIAYLVEMPSVSAFADSPQTALNELIVAWEGVKESYRQHGEEIPHLAMTKN